MAIRATMDGFNHRNLIGSLPDHAGADRCCQSRGRCRQNCCSDEQSRKRCSHEVLLCPSLSALYRLRLDRQRCGPPVSSPRRLGGLRFFAGCAVALSDRRAIRLILTTSNGAASNGVASSDDASSDDASSNEGANTAGASSIAANSDAANAAGVH
jgi:hypothetical protein